jgi:peptidoglycan/xylan/chitin deacetylase (PgdA/CDA1 family)
VKGAKYLRRTFCALRRRFIRGGVILLYHRVIDLPTDPHNLAVSPQRFAQHLQYIRRTCEPMRLFDFVEALLQRTLPPRAIAITFDDGYADNYRYAYPLLKSAGIPATVFVTAGQVDSSCEFWWDDLERILLLPNHLPSQLRLEIQGLEYRWQLGPLGQRERVHRDLHDLLRTLDGNCRDETIASLASWAGLKKAGRSDYRAMTAVELVELAQSELVDIGAHTLTHPVLSALSTDAQTTEIVDGQQRLESITSEPVATFAYPYGSAQDFTGETAEVVRAAGFHAACTTIPGSVEHNDDPFRLRRCAVFNWDKGTFCQQLKSFLVSRE